MEIKLPLLSITLVLVVLKLTHVIDWSWIVVLIPLWIVLAFWGIFLLALLVLGIMALVAALLS